VPENDFSDYMTSPSPFGAPPPSSWAGSSYFSPQTSFSQIGGQRFGNIGMYAGMGMDAMLPQYRGMWDVRAAGGLGNAVRAHQQVGRIEQMMKEQQGFNEERSLSFMRGIGGAGFDKLSQDDQQTLTGIVGMIPGAQRIMNPGALSFQGMQQAYGGLANYGNQWTPSKQQLTGFHNAFQSYFYSGGKENFARTGGLDADTMMSVVAETSRRGAMKPASYEEARREQDLAFGRVGISGAMQKAGITTVEISKKLEEFGGNTGDLKEYLKKRVSAVDKDGAEKAVFDYEKSVLDAAGGQVDINTLRYAGSMKAAGKYKDVLKSFQGAGYGGDISQLMDTLESSFGDAALDPNRMRAVGQKMAAIVDMTGKSLDQVRALMDVIQNGPGARLTAEKALGITSISSGVGMNIQGLTKAQRLEMGGKAAEALATVEKSPRAVVEDILIRSGDAGARALGKQLQGAGGASGRSMLRDIMTSPGKFGLSAGTAAAFQAMAMGDMTTAATMRNMQDEETTRQVNAYNESLGSGKPDAAARGRLEALGVTFEGDKAIMGSQILSRNERAAKDVLGELVGQSDMARGALSSAGAAIGKDLTEQQQLEVGAAFASMSNMGANKPPIPAFQAAYKKITGKDISAEDVSARMAEATGRLAPMSSSPNRNAFLSRVNTATAMLTYDAATAARLEAESKKTAALNTIGDVLGSKDALSMVFGGAGGVEGAMKAAGIDVSKHGEALSALKAISGLDDKGREDLKGQIEKYQEQNVLLQGATTDTGRKSLEADLQTRRESMAKSMGISADQVDKFLGDMSSEAFAGMTGAMRDVSQVRSREKQIEVFVKGYLETSDGKKIPLEKDEQGNAANGQNPTRAEKK